MEFKDVIQNRYSCKDFSTQQIEKEKLTEILFALECSKYGIQREIPSNLKELRKKVIGA